ncbi:hypothetical protein LIER_25708 [Lithospermum erythrorhizon]|uniref:Uncharacterized protein n=1 Tax=Lithospermum erythrorhizon TaxID=34254 RepID=A0AAV3R723_LITER
MKQNSSPNQKPFPNLFHIKNVGKFIFSIIPHQFRNGWANSSNVLQVMWAKAGHGWIEWDDAGVSPQVREKRSSTERISCLERMLFDVEEDVRQLKHEKGGFLDENLVLKKELEKQQMYTKCLKKYVNTLLFLLCLAAIFIVNCGSNDDVEAI